MFFSIYNIHMWIAIALSLANGIILPFAGYKFLQIIQLSGYKISGYRLWIKDTHAGYISRLSMLSFISVSCMLVTIALFDFYQSDNYFSYFGLIFYFYFVAIFIKYLYQAPKKTPLKQTWRMSRLCVTLGFLVGVTTFALIYVATEFVPLLRFAVISLTPMTLPFLVPLAHFIMLPFEALNRKKYVVKAKHKLSKQENLIKIGITGSYGKTSTKYILNCILSEKYDVCYSPYSFNTPMGLTKVVLDYLKPEHEVLIAEMGAKNIGDIKYLCDIINPQYGILTAIGSQHLSTFGTVENIKKTKYELIEAIPLDNGYAVFNGDCPALQSLYEKCEVTKTQTSVENKDCDIHSENEKITENGLEFDLVINNEKIGCTCSLLGKHNLQNILMCTAIAYKLGLTLEEISKGISKLKPINHRLELIKENGLIILDDSYNSSVQGVDAALEVVSMLKGGQKVIVTPGLIELGQNEKEENANFGKKISKVFDKVIIVNETNKESILKGLKEEEYPEEQIEFAPSLPDAQLKLRNTLKPGDIILFENDLPDNYT